MSKRWPPKVHEKHGALYYVDRNRWTKLCRVVEGESALYQALYHQQVDIPITDTSRLIDMYIAEVLPDKAPKTQHEYLRIIAKSLRPFFGEAHPSKIRPTDIAKYLRAKGNVQANRDRAVLSAIFTYAMELGLMDINPCHGIPRNPERPAKLYIEDDWFRVAFDLAPEHIQDAMAIAYLTGMRQGDLLSLRREHITDKGIRWQEGKTSRPRWIIWSDALAFFIKRALERSKSDWLITGRDGEKYVSSALQTAWKRLMAKVEHPFTFRDIRAKAATDAVHGRQLLDHASESIFKRHYKRRPDPVKPVH